MCVDGGVEFKDGGKRGGGAIYLWAKRERGVVGLCINPLGGCARQGSFSSCCPRDQGAH